MTFTTCGVSLFTILLVFVAVPCTGRKLRSVPTHDQQENQQLSNSVEYILSVITVARGDTAVLHCSFDAIIQTLPNANIEWYKGQTKQPKQARKRTRRKLSKRRRRKWKRHDKTPIINMSYNQRFNQFNQTPLPTLKPITDEWELTGAVAIATGKRVLIDDPRYRVFRPRNSALSVMIIRKTKKKDGGVYRCNLSRSSTRHRYMILNVTESKIEAQTSVTVMKTKVGDDVTLWCNATGYPKPVVYWMRKDRNRTLPDGNLQFWGNGLQIKSATEMDTGVYECFLDNFVQPIVNYRFTLMVEDSNPWTLEGYKMRFDSKQWYPVGSEGPGPITHKSFLLMCDTRGTPKPLPLIRWYRSGELVRNSKHYYIIEDSPETRTTYTSSTLVIMDFRSRFSGHYSCVAYTSYRMKKVTFELKG